MLYSQIKEKGVGLQEGIDPTKVYPVSVLCNEETIDLLSGHFDLSALNIPAFRIFTANEKERASISLALDKIEALNLKDIFNANLDIRVLREDFVGRVEYCLNNRLPFVHQDSNALISVLYDADAFAAYTTKEQPISEVKTHQEVKEEPAIYNGASENVFTNVALDAEDSEVRSSLLRTLLEIKETNKDDFTFGFLITNIIANLDMVIAQDNKNYRVMGTRHLIESALEGVSLTPEMQEEIDVKILSAFPINESMGRGA